MNNNTYSENQNPPETTKLLIVYTSHFKSPYTADFKFDQFYLNTSELTSENFKWVKSIAIQGESSLKDQNGQRIDITDIPDGEYSDLIIIIHFEIEITKTSKYKKTIVNPALGPPLPDETIAKLQQQNQRVISSLVKYIAWRKNYTMNQAQIGKASIHYKWVVDDIISENYYQESYTVSGIRRDVCFEIPIQENEFSDFYRMNKGEIYEPVYRELLTEVEGLMNSYRTKSAYLTLYTAFEVATKIFIKTKKPDTEFLISKLPSPDLHKLYTEYINEKIIPIITDKKEQALLKTMAGKRNEIAHQGKDIDQTTVYNHYLFVKRVINELDIHMGYEWVKK